MSSILNAEEQKQVALAIHNRGDKTITEIAAAHGLARTTARRYYAKFVDEFETVDDNSTDLSEEIAFATPTKEVEEPRWLATNQSIIVQDGTELRTLSSDDVNFEAAKEAILIQDWASLLYIVNKPKAISEFSEGNIVVKGNVLTYKNREIENVMVQRILDEMNNNGDYVRMARFMDRMMDNPSYKVVNNLWRFLEHNDIEITDDGYFVAFKVVRDDFKDIYTGTIDNSVGEVVSMERNEVEDNPNKTCSAGLHVAAWSYITWYESHGNKVIRCKVDPRDVVSCPVDYKNAKLRVCKYEVTSETTWDR